MSGENPNETEQTGTEQIGTQQTGTEQIDAAGEGADTERLAGMFDSETEPGADATTAAETDAPAAAPRAARVPDAEPWLGHWDLGGVERTTPRIRWAGIIWGLVFVAAGWFALWTLLAESRRAAFSSWVLTLDGGGWAIAAAFALGGLLLVLGLIAALRAATRQRTPS